MHTSDEIKARLHHGAYELRQALQLLATASDHIQTASDGIQVCIDRADLIEPAINELKHQIQSLVKETSEVYSLRNDESDLYLRQENAQLKKDLATLQKALCDEMEERQARLPGLVKSNEELVQHIEGLEPFTRLLKLRINEMKEKYESAVTEIAELKSTNRTLQGIIALNVAANTPASSDLNRPDRGSLNHDGIPQILSAVTSSFPDIASQPHFTPANGGSTQVVIRAPGMPKSRPIVRGTQEANESFERMKRSLAISPLANSTNVFKDNNKAIVPPSSSTSGLPIPIITPLDVRPMTPSKAKSKLNPAVTEFTPSDNSGKDSAKSDSVQALSPSKVESKSQVTATGTEEKGFIAPHLRRLSKVSIKEGPVPATEEESVKAKIKYQGVIATNAQSKSSEEAEPLQATSSITQILPHLQHLTSVIKNEDVRPSQVQRSDRGKNKENIVDGSEFLSHKLALTGMKENTQAVTTPGAFVKPDPGLEAWLNTQEKAQSKMEVSHEWGPTANDNLIDLDSPKAGEKKTVPLPPGFIPFMANNAPAKTETAIPVKTDNAKSPIAADKNDTSGNPSRNPSPQKEGTTAEHKVPTKTTEKEMNAAFIAEYYKMVASVSEKYGRESRNGSDTKENAFDPVKYEGAKQNYIPSKPTGTHELGSLLDNECRKMVLKTRNGVKAEELAVQEWKAVFKDGKVVYVL